MLLTAPFSDTRTNSIIMVSSSVFYTLLFAMGKFSSISTGRVVPRCRKRRWREQMSFDRLPLWFARRNVELLSAARVLIDQVNPVSSFRRSSSFDWLNPCCLGPQQRQQRWIHSAQSIRRWSRWNTCVSEKTHWPTQEWSLLMHLQAFSWTNTDWHHEALVSHLNRSFSANVDCRSKLCFWADAI